MRHFSARVLAVFILLLSGLAAARAQAPAYGDWQIHLPARHPLTLANAGSRLYVADESSFYFYDKNTNSTQQLSRRDGLSDVGVATLAYDSATAQVVVAYRNGNIDLIGSSGAVRNITDLLRKESQVAKVINQVQIYNSLAYINTNLGVVVLDLVKKEVRDTYGAIGPGGTVVNALATVVLHDTIFASTSAGLLRGRLSSTVNLLDYRSWTREQPAPGASAQVFPAAAAYRGHLYVASNFRGLDYLAGTGATRSWRVLPGSYGENVRRLRPSPVGLLFAFSSGGVQVFDATKNLLSRVLPVAVTGDAQDVARDSDGTYFVASYTYGLLRFAPGSPTAEAIKPNAPATTQTFGLLANAATNTVDVFPGGYQDNSVGQNRRGFYEYQAGQWTNYTAETYPSPTDYPNLIDLSRGTRTPNGTLYIASYGNGVLEWNGPAKWKQYTATTAGSPLRTSLDPVATNLDFVRVTDVAADPTNGTVWVINRHQRSTVPGLFRLHPATGKWDGTPYFSNFENLDRLTVDTYGNPWASVSRRAAAGLAVFDTLSRQALPFNKSNGLPDNLVYALVRDRTGSIWVGTGAGVASIDPSSVQSFLNNNGASPVFATPLVTRGAGRGFQALYNETVTCIAVDGANRKWFGTPNGLWLFSANANEALLNFTTANSPLPSNSIVDVAVNDKTGEVFVATDGGVVSYRGSASVTEGSPSCAQVSPNPVRPEFVGTVGISGVANDAQVKITDIAGHLVYSTRAAGGTVTWNLHDVDGRRVRSGVYLVLTADAEGKNTCVSKVAVLSN